MKKAILVIIIIIFLSGCGYSRPNQGIEENFIEPEKKERNGEDNNINLQKKGISRNISISGVILKLEKDFLHILTKEREEVKILLTPKTMYLRMYINKAGVLINQETIGRSDLIENKAGAVDAYWEDDNREELKALIVKQRVLVKE